MMERFCYVYAITQREARVPVGLTGLDDAPLSLVFWQDLAAVVSPIESASLSTIPAYLLRHEAVVEALCQAAPTLPARFGTVLDDTVAVAQAIAGKYTRLRADLARVGDKVELGLIILWNVLAGQDEAKAEQQTSMIMAKPLSSASGSGTRYLEARLAYYRRETAQQNEARTVITVLEQALRRYTLEQRYRVLLSPRLAVRAAYLVQPGQIQAFQHAVDKVRKKEPDLHWLLSGPWPPYTFVTGASGFFQQGPGLKIDGIEG